MDLFSTEQKTEKKENPPQKFELRDYQKEAISRILWSMSLPGNDLCVLPTGAGKSLVIAYLAKELNQPILILQPSKEILEQNHKKLCSYVNKKDVGIYSASLNSKEIKYYTFATIQSIYKKPEYFKHFKLVLIDECHLVNVKNTGSMFASFLKAIGNPKVIGFTATPYRMMTGYFSKGVYNGYRELEASVTIKLINRVRPVFWTRIIFNINNKELEDMGYLSPLEYLDASIVSHKEIPINKSQSDFEIEAYERIIAEKPKQERILAGIQWAEQNYKSVLVFCSSINQAKKLSEVVPNSAVVTGSTHKKERERIIEEFKEGKIKTVFNMGVLTTGFDHPALDCIILLRPTRSIALYYQMLGRGVRIAEGKKYCKVIDFTATVKNLGKINTIELVKEGNLWELKTETGNWHNKQLYSYDIQIEIKKKNG